MTTQCQPSAANAFIWARHIKPMLGQPWRKIINDPSAGPHSM
jgi:hypothetical protein